MYSMCIYIYAYIRHIEHHAFSYRTFCLENLIQFWSSLSICLRTIQQIRKRFGAKTRIRNTREAKRRV